MGRQELVDRREISNVTPSRRAADVRSGMGLYEKLNILTDAAKYDVACTSSGTARKSDGTGIGSC